MKAGMLHVLTYLVLSTSLTVTAGTARGDELVIPGGLENIEGNEDNFFPFGFGFGFSYRYQQVYAASEFDPSAPVLITEIRFRPDFLQGSSFSTVLPNVQINLSTTSRTADSLSSTFADNVGPDDTVVSAGALPLSSNATGPGPLDFDIVIALSTPFFYDPLQGNLLLDVRNFGSGESITPLDAEDTPGDSISRVTTSFVSGNVDSPTADFNDSIGLVTKFVFAPSAVIEVAIDVKPGSLDNPVNLNSAGSIPVAILTSDDFDAAAIDPDQPMLLGDPDLAGAVSPARSMPEDVDSDGDLDLLLHFSLRELVEAGAIDQQSQFLGLSATTLDGTDVVGVDAVTVVSK